MEVELMSNLGLIKPSTSEYSSSVITVEAEGKESRAFIDYRKLNSITRTPQYPMPTVEEKMEQVVRAKWDTGK